MAEKGGSRVDIVMADEERIRVRIPAEVLPAGAEALNWEVAVSRRGRRISVHPQDPGGEQLLNRSGAHLEMGLPVMGNRRLVAAVRRTAGTACMHQGDSGQWHIDLPAPTKSASLRRGGLMGACAALMLGAGIGVGTQWRAPPPGPPPAPKILSLSAAKALIKNASKGRATATKVFAGPHGLSGIVIKGGREKTVGWAVGTGGPLLAVGELFDQHGRDLTDRADHRYHIQPLRMSSAQVKPSSAHKTADTSKALTPQALLHDISTHGHAIPNEPGLKDPAHTIWIFIDANCPYCHATYVAARHLRKQLQTEGVQIEYLPTAVLKRSSIGKAAAILAGGEAALARNEKHFDIAHESGAIQPIQSVAYISQVRDNTILLNVDGRVPAVPTAVWTGANHTVHVRPGTLSRTRILAIAAALRAQKPGGQHG